MSLLWKDSSEYGIKIKTMAIKKEIRVKVWNKFNKKCAYCGHSLEYKKMQVDHKVPLYRNDCDFELLRMKIKRGTDDENNLYPSCSRCNRWKSTYDIESFRKEIELQIERLKRDSNQFRMALDFELITETENHVRFWFEHF